MKIGLNLANCVADILDGKVAIKSILVIIAGSKFDIRNSVQWNSVYEYHNMSGKGVWKNYTNDQVFHCVEDLIDRGLLFLPHNHSFRAQNYLGHQLNISHSCDMNVYWLETIIDPSYLSENAAVTVAFNHYQFLAGLAGQPK